jgi:hypothetical protein
MMTDDEDRSEQAVFLPMPRWDSSLSTLGRVKRGSVSGGSVIGSIDSSRDSVTAGKSLWEANRDKATLLLTDPALPLSLKVSASALRAFVEFLHQAIGDNYFIALLDYLHAPRLQVAWLRTVSCPLAHDTSRLRHVCASVVSPR